MTRAPPTVALSLLLVGEAAVSGPSPARRAPAGGWINVHRSPFTRLSLPRDCKLHEGRPISILFTAQHGAECLALSRGSMSISWTIYVLFSLSFTSTGTWGTCLSISTNPLGWGKELVFKISEQHRQLPSARVCHVIAVIAISPSPVIATQGLKLKSTHGEGSVLPDVSQGGGLSELNEGY